MKKKIDKIIKENTQVELPEKLKRENIEKMLTTEETTDSKVIEFKPKKHTARKVIALAASFAVVLGIASVAGQSVKNRVIRSKAAKTIIVSCSDYDEIYKQLDAIKAQNQASFTDKAKEFFQRGKYESIADYATEDKAVVSNETVQNGTAQVNDSSSAYGQTNTQESDVDEGYVIKTDGKYIYVISEGQIYIASSKDGKLEKIAKIKAENKEYDDLRCTEIYVQDNKLIAIGNAYTYNGYDTYGEIAVNDGMYRYGYAPYVNSNTFINIYDLSDINNICLVKQYIQQGHCISSRITGGKVYCISQHSVDIYAEDYKNNCIPEIIDGENKESIACEDISIIPGTNSPVYTVVTSCSIDGKSKTDSNAILGYTDDVYATSENLFLVASTWDEKDEQTTTNIYKFAYTDKGAKFEAEGSVPGYINNQFSLDYENGYLRIATTYDLYTTNGLVKEFDGQSNALFVLNKNMEIIGKLDNLAENEIIKSARYIGDYAYVVTFRQTDPLFVIDLSNPKKPQVVGALSLPGFSSYLHPYLSNYMIGIGSDGDEENINNDCKISLFDISDKTKPSEVSKITVATDENFYVYSDIGYNHKDFVSLPQNEFAVSFTEEKYEDYDETYGYERHSMFIRYKVEDEKIIEVARYMLDGDDTVVAGTYIGEYFFILAEGYRDDAGYESYLNAYSLVSHEKLGQLVLK